MDEITYEFNLADDGKVTAPEIARVMNMNAKSVRRRIRAMSDDRVGRGGEWRFTVDQAGEICKRLATSNGRRTNTGFTFKDDQSD